jgi:hypothetical protein
MRTRSWTGHWPASARCNSSMQAPAEAKAPKSSIFQGFAHKEGYRARYSGGLIAAPELPGVAPPPCLLALLERGGLVHA